MLAGKIKDIIEYETLTIYISLPTHSGIPKKLYTAYLGDCPACIIFWAKNMEPI